MTTSVVGGFSRAAHQQPEAVEGYMRDVRRSAIARSMEILNDAGLRDLPEVRRARVFARMCLAVQMQGRIAELGSWPIALDRPGGGA